MAYSTADASFYEIQVKFPLLEWDKCTLKAYRTKVLLVKKKAVEMQRNKRKDDMSDFLCQSFELPLSKVNSTLDAIEDTAQKAKVDVLV